MDNDDEPIGRILSRRDALKLLGLGGAALLSACAPAGTASPAAGTPLPTLAATTIPSVIPSAAASQAVATAITQLDCVVRPELTLGPYFVDGQLNRGEIRTDSSDNTLKPGLPLALTVVVAGVGGNACAPLEGAQVDIWHCDAQGQYSGVTDGGFNTTGRDFLRGYQVTGADGAARFQTIYPGWYPGRAVHIHFTIRTKAANGEDYQFTSQFFFDDALSDQVYTLEPYAAKGQRNIRNNADNIFNGGGEQLLLNLSGDLSSGYTGTMSIGLDLTDMGVGAAESGGRGGPGANPPP